MEALYKIKCSLPSDINEHLPTLMKYASECNSVVECGVRDVVSSYAFGMGLKGKLDAFYVLVDPYKSKQIDGFLKLCKNESINATFIEKSDLDCPLFSTDLLFIDTWHVYGQLKRELARWHTSVNKYIIMHDTTVDADVGESIRCGFNIRKQIVESGFPEHEIRKGLWPAVQEFLDSNKNWKLLERFTNNNGLTILHKSSSS
jgi:hypothetical protein